MFCSYLQMVASKRLQQAQAQVGEVVDIMRVNVEKVLERDQKLSELDRRADDLQEGASQFQQQVGNKPCLLPTTEKTLTLSAFTHLKGIVTMWE